MSDDHNEYAPVRRFIQVTKVKPGMRVFRQRDNHNSRDSQTIEVESTSTGLWRGSTILNYVGYEYTCLNNDDFVQVKCFKDGKSWATQV